VREVKRHSVQRLASIPPADADHELKTKVRELLVTENVPSLRRLDVDVDRGTLVISGTVPTFYAKQLVHNRCRQLRGVHRVRMNVRVA